MIHHAEDFIDENDSPEQQAADLKRRMVDADVGDIFVNANGKAVIKRGDNDWELVEEENK